MTCRFSTWVVRGMAERSSKKFAQIFHEDTKFSVAAVQECGTWGTGMKEELGQFSYYLTTKKEKMRCLAIIVHEWRNP